MRWNPQNPGTNQYASDIDWDDNIAQLMARYYDKYGIKKDHIHKAERALLQRTVDQNSFALSNCASDCDRM